VTQKYYTGSISETAMETHAFDDEQVLHLASAHFSLLDEQKL
jgi:hypothetical protein